jgi:hypothetical protein
MIGNSGPSAIRDQASDFFQLALIDALGGMLCERRDRPLDTRSPKRNFDAMADA